MDAKTPQKFLRLHQRDNVALALVPLAPGESVEGVTVRESIPVGHKVALGPIAVGEGVFKYANLIAVANTPIAAGAHVHIAAYARLVHREIRPPHKLP